MMGTHSSCYWEIMMIGAEEAVFLRTCFGRGGRGCSGTEGKSLGGVKSIWCSGVTQQISSIVFPPLFTSLLHLTASDLEKVLTILDLCRAWRNWWMSDRVGNNPVVRVQMPDMQAVQFQALNIFFSAILCGLHELVLKSNSIDEEFLLSLLLWWTVRMIYVKVLWLSEQMKSVVMRIVSDFVRYWFYCSSGEEKRKVNERKKSVIFILFLWMLLQALECVF